MLLHGLNDFGACDHPRLREARQDQLKAKKVIAMSVRDVDRGQVLAARSDPISQFRGGLDGEERVDKDCIAGTVDKRCRVRHPFEVVFANRRVTTEAGPRFASSPPNAAPSRLPTSRLPTGEGTW